MYEHYGGSMSTMPKLSTISFTSPLANTSSPSPSSFTEELPISVEPLQTNRLEDDLSTHGLT